MNPPPDEPPEPAYEPFDPGRPASASPTEGDLEREVPGGRRSGGHDPYAALQVIDYRRYLAGSVIAVIGQQMLGVAVGWELFERTRSATALGLVGLVQALPILVLALPAGNAADVLPRKAILLSAQAMMGVSSAGMALVSYRHDRLPDLAAIRAINAMLGRLATGLGEPSARFDDPAIPLLYALLLTTGIARAFSTPARSALLPGIVPARSFSNAVTWSSSGSQVASMAGPALGGLLVGLSGTWPGRFAVAYLADTACIVAAMAMFARLTVARHDRRGERVSLASLAAGVRFVVKTEIILATITLDMLAVLLGGATALLPIFAGDILRVGPTGLGWLRAAPSVGAFAMAILLAHRPPLKRAGPALLWAVAGFGLATIGFGLSSSFGISILMLLLAGALDNVSVVVRHTLVQVLTPDRMRGRVSAVNNMFIGTSNELGAFESGVTAAILGPVAAVVVGGLGTILVVAAVAAAWPSVRRFGPLDGTPGAD